MYISERIFGVEISSSFTLYREIKRTYGRADYLQVLENIKFRNVLVKLRLSSDKLSSETERHRDTHRKDRNAFYVILMT